MGIFDLIRQDITVYHQCALDTLNVNGQNEGFVLLSVNNGEMNDLRSTIMNLHIKLFLVTWLLYLLEAKVIFFAKQIWRAY